MLVFRDPLEFEWDKGNDSKNMIKHSVTNTECEEAFQDENRGILQDSRHSIEEDRYILLGKTALGRLLYISFTLREKKIRVISARDINKRELPLYNIGS